LEVGGSNPGIAADQCERPRQRGRGDHSIRHIRDSISVDALNGFGNAGVKDSKFVGPFRVRQSIDQPSSGFGREPAFFDQVSQFDKANRGNQNRVSGRRRLVERARRVTESLGLSVKYQSAA
jgi:hypothetical protein